MAAPIAGGSAAHTIRRRERHAGGARDHPRRDRPELSRNRPATARGELGVLLQQAQNVRSVALHPWLMIPGLCVILAVLAFNFLGDGAARRRGPLPRTIARRAW